ncbi:MAG: acetyl-CoA carboxylase biotin carboxylase subunit [Balneolaceae bacterium]
MKSAIRKVLIANRGEIALRIIRTCQELDIKTVAVYSEADSESPHVLQAGESICIGAAASSESYLSVDRILEAARKSGADAIHPGYGFLSENGSFAKRCEEEGIIFIGPGYRAIEMMGDKTTARSLMKSAGVPYPPGSEEALRDLESARQCAARIGFPLLVKAAAGGGGKGMRIIQSEKELEAGLQAARSEAKSAFGDDRVYIEKYLSSPRHVEFQIVADRQGHVIHLFDRECSIQRRHQKVIEEAPCAVLDESLRSKMSEAAIAAAKACNYLGAGTIEFLVDGDNRFYFLEMNTRLQVEHPVTEMITGVDLVELQIRIAEGEPLPYRQEDLSIRGHAIECRIYAEDPSDQFLPNTGTLKRHRPAAGPGVRVDAGVEEGMEITINYDPMISKLCVLAPDRESAIRRMLRALDEYEVEGCRTTIPFCSYVLKHPDFQSGMYNTHFVQDHFRSEMLASQSPNEKKITALAATLIATAGNRGNGQNELSENPSGTAIPAWWQQRRRLNRRAQ